MTLAAKNIIFSVITLYIMACHSGGNEKKENTSTASNQTENTAEKQNNNALKNNATVPVNDTLNDLANFIAGQTKHSYKTLEKFRKEKSFLSFSENFSKKWKKFDSTKLAGIRNFTQQDFKPYTQTKNIFYPFSGPDVLFASTFFPEANNFTLIGLEPVGTLPIIDDKDLIPDSIHHYFNKINTSLYAILNFSFFRTVAMKEDLRNTEVDGTIHLILLFLNKTGHNICSIKPFYIDSLGNKNYVKNTLVLKNKNYRNSSIEIIVSDAAGNTKNYTYTSTDLSDGGLLKNKGLITYLKNLNMETTYLKGASYLMHKPGFKQIRNLILDLSNTVVQDDSGIAMQYISSHKDKWEYHLFGEYHKPIPMFSQHYQKDLDSLYKTQGSKKLGFGLGYNYRDKNSNFMVIKKTGKTS